jgi:hypothetical protein
MKRVRSKGQSLVETALILTGFMTLLLGMVGVGQMLFTRQMLADRVREAARWGAVNGYDLPAIRNLVLYGTTMPGHDARPLLGLAPSAVVVGNSGCPGAECRISVAIPEDGIQSTEPVEPAD